MTAKPILKRVRTQDGSLPPTYAEVARAAWAATVDLRRAIVDACNASGLPRGYVLHVLTGLAYKEFGGIEAPAAPPPIAQTGETRSGTSLVCDGLPVSHEPCSCWHGDYNHPPETCNACNVRADDEAEYEEFLEFLGGEAGIDALNRLYELAFQAWQASQTRLKAKYNPFADEDGEATDCTRGENLLQEGKGK